MKKNEKINELLKFPELVTAGLPLARKIDSLYRLAHDFVISPFVSNATPSLELNLKEANQFLQGCLVEIKQELINKFFNQWLLVKFKGHLIGIGKVTHKGLLPFIPKERRTNLSCS